ncbi:amblin-like [Dermacentor albipictus]|uniref:amblin-like n=1 Tax=Dermacentor albipictus TaxID=60249 RepID=UPI0031FC1425
MRFLCWCFIFTINVVLGPAYSEKLPDRCFKEPEAGRCRAYQPTWYFDTKFSSCRMFIYGGCGGNDNQFPSEKKCQSVCLPSWQPKRICSAKPKHGHGKVPPNFWYFDSGSATCQRYKSGLSERRVNKYPSCEKCMAACTTGRTEKVVCSRPPYPQKCALGPRWFFNSSLRTCQWLPHGTCATSANKFQKCLTCMARCTNFNEKDTCHAILKEALGHKKPG